jgi:predicted negative regulator of RcsB-dependent stress response
MPVTHRKLRRKELRQPDEFITFFENLRGFLLDNLVQVIIGACAAIALAAIGFGVFFYMQYRDRLVADQFYEAITALDHKEYKTAETDFSKLAEDHPGASLGRLARFYLASCYMAEKDPAKARDALNEYLAGDDRPTFKSLAQLQLGVAYEDLGQFQQAHQAYSEAAKLPGPQKLQAELAAARMLVREGQKDAAIAAYRQFLKENPFAEERTDAFVALTELGVQPEARRASAPAVSAPKSAPGTSPAASASTSAASPSGKPATAVSSAAAGTNVAPNASPVSAVPAAASTSATSAVQSPQSTPQQKK